MKMERISENQIRCTLNKNDLLDRELRISELAYGTEKAKDLFRDMMQQASYELGFEAEDIPLMIEAIPVSAECLVLIITKVEDPDELDTRFSRFSPDNGEEFDLEDNMDSYTDNTYAYDNVSYEPKDSGNLLDADKDFIPLPEAVAPQNVYSRERTQESENVLPICRIFSFASLDEIIDLSKELNSLYQGANSLFKDTEKDLYYLVLSKGKYSIEDFNKVCNVTSEFGIPERNTYATLSYFEEHFTLITKGNAIQVLSTL